MSMKLRTILWVASSLACATRLPASTLFVDSRVEGCGDGLGWSTAYKHLQDALAAARNSGGSITGIWVAAGSYYPDRDCASPQGSGRRDASFQLVDGVTVLGGFAGTEDPATFAIDDRDLHANRTILSGDLAVNDGPNAADNGENSYNVVIAAVPACTLDGVTITGGNANGPAYVQRNGAGIRVFSGSPTFVKCLVNLNVANSGAGITNAGGHVVLRECVIGQNTSTGGNASGVANDSGSANLSDCTLAGNSRYALWNQAQLSLHRCVFQANGSGVYTSGNAVADSCTFENTGSPFSNTSGSPRLTNCIFLRNVAASSSGSGGVTLYGTPTLINCTFAGNVAGRFGPAGAVTSNGNPRLVNCVLWGNSSPQISGPAQVTHSCIQGGWSGEGNIDADPGFLSLSAGQLRLRYGSPCIDAGDGAALPSDLTHDAAGVPRQVDDPAMPDTGRPGTSAEAVPDMGAYEYAPVEPVRLHVSQNTPEDGDGREWATAFRFLQDALKTAEADAAVTEICVAKGTYKPDRERGRPLGSGDRNATFRLANRVRILGGFLGQAGPDGGPGYRNPTTEETLLSGDLAGNDSPQMTNMQENSAHVVTAAWTDGSTVLSGFVITGGQVESGAGGGLSAEGAGLRVEQCVFRHNKAFKGAGAYSKGGNPSFYDCLFEENTGDCAGLESEQGNPVLIRCRFERNGGIGMRSNGSPSLTECTFTANSGYGVSNNGGTPRFDTCTFTDHATSSMINWGATARLYGCTFKGNANAITNRNCSPLLVNCAIFMNTDTAIDNKSSSPTLIHCTVAGNSARTGAGISSDYGPGANVVNCILWGNPGSQIQGPATVRFSCVEGGWPGDGNIADDPRLMFAPSDLRLRRGSPCIDAADTASVPAEIQTDLDGGSRCIDDPDTPDTGRPGNPPGAVSDMGALEYEPVPARRLHVRADAEQGGSGLDWAGAFRHLQDALRLAQTDTGVHEIWVATGVYTPDRDSAHPEGTADPAATFHLPGGVAIYGGFRVTDSICERDPALWPTMLSGDLAGHGGSGGNNTGAHSFHVVTTILSGDAAVLDGLTVSRGDSGGDTKQPSGAGLYGFGSSLRVNGCVFEANRAPLGGGGAVYCIGGRPTFSLSKFLGNSAGDGGGITSVRARPVLVNCALAQNSATSVIGWGGAIACDGGALTVTNCTLFANSAYTVGGISGRQADVAISNCIIWRSTNGQLHGSDVTVSHSCIEGGWTGTGNMALNPRLMFPEGGDLRLRKGSPCVDAGSNIMLPGSVATDLAGRPRFSDDPATPDTGEPDELRPAVVDIGAFEYEPVATRRCLVHAAAGPGGDGLTWGTAYGHLQDALQQARIEPGVVEIWVAQGVYRPDRSMLSPGGTGDPASSFSLPDGVGLHGGFSGSEDPATFDLSQRRLADCETILSGDLAGDDAGLSGSSRENAAVVLRSAYVGPEAVLDGFTLTGAQDPSLGAATFTNGASPTVHNCRFASNGGHGVRTGGGNPAFVNCVFLANRGDGVYIHEKGGPLLINCTATANQNAFQADWSSSATLRNCVLWNNNSYPGFLGTVNATYCCFQQNHEGEGNISLDPQLLANGRLRRGSPCIDAGDNLAFPGGINHDAQGRARFLDDPDTPNLGRPGDPPLPVIDMGAYEYTPVEPIMLYVRSGAAARGDGRDWGTAFRFLQDALTRAQVDPSVKEIRIASGTYRPDQSEAHAGGSRDRAATFTLAGGVMISGSFANRGGPADAWRQDLTAHPTILSGDLLSDDDENFSHVEDNCYHVVTARAVGAGTSLNSLAITGGNAISSEDSESSLGGGLQVLRSTLAIERCRFTGNSAEWGGGLSLIEGSPRVLACFIAGNRASFAGGGCALVETGASVTNCVLLANQTDGMGGAVYSSSNGDQTVTNCSFSANSAREGGAVFASYNLSLRNSVLWGNVAEAGSQIRGSATATYSCVQGGWSGAGNIKTDPLYISAGGNLRLGSGSPCIDAGRNLFIPADVSTDVFGWPRFVDAPGTPDCRWAPGTCGTAPVVDMGAYEFTLIPGDADSDLDVDGDDLAVLATCAAGPCLAPLPGCASLDGDSDVDGVDFAIFQRCWSGADVFGDPRCR